MQKIIGISAAGTLALVLTLAAPAAHATTTCTAKLHKNVKYRFITFDKMGKVHKRGWIEFTDRMSRTGDLNLAWIKTEGEEQKPMWGKHGDTSVLMNTYGMGAFWAFPKYCSGDVLTGAVRKNGTRESFFRLYTERKR